nr:tyrosyl-tRNA synthetase [Tanacetum cinerariifolium]
MDTDMKKIQVVGEYMIEIWKADEMKLENVEFLWSFDEINKRAHEYWHMVMDIATKNSVGAAKLWDEKDDLTVAQVFYPLMQFADVFFLKADICQLGMDQRKVNALANEYCDVIKRKNKPLISSHHKLPGLLQGQEKMSKSDSSSSVFIEDEETDVKSKIKKAYCSPRIVEETHALSISNTLYSLGLTSSRLKEKWKMVVQGSLTLMKNLLWIMQKVTCILLKPALSHALNKILQMVVGGVDVVVPAWLLCHDEGGDDGAARCKRDHCAVGNKMHKAFPLPGEKHSNRHKFPLPVEGVPTARRMEIPLPGVCTAMMKKLPVKEN